MKELREGIAGSGERKEERVRTQEGKVGPQPTARNKGTGEE